jgi:hypothetical protein
VAVVVGTVGTVAAEAAGVGTAVVAAGTDTVDPKKSIVARIVGWKGGCDDATCDGRRRTTTKFQLVNKMRIEPSTQAFRIPHLGIPMTNSGNPKKNKSKGCFGQKLIFLVVPKS